MRLDTLYKGSAYSTAHNARYASYHPRDTVHSSAARWQRPAFIPIRGRRVLCACMHTARDTERYTQITWDSQYHGHTANTEHHKHHQRLSPTDTPQKPPRLGPGKRHEGRHCERKVLGTAPRAASPPASLPSSAWAQDGRSPGPARRTC